MVCHGSTLGYWVLKDTLQEYLAMVRPTSGTEPQYEELRYEKHGEEG